MADAAVTQAFTVPDAARPYLIAQRGELSDLAGNPTVWLDAYRASLQTDFDEIGHHLPAHCAALLDIGSGLGGIDALLARAYGHPPDIWLLDGAYDAPVMTRHDLTFSSRSVALDLLRANGIGGSVGYVTPAETCDAITLPLFDLVLSFQAWCFHFPPQAYLALALRHLTQGGRLIVDVRRDKPVWDADLGRALEHIVTVRDRPKYERRVYRKRSVRVG